MVLVDGRPVAACYRHLPNRSGYAHGIPPAQDREGWARDLLAKLRRDLATSDDNAA
ncbi:hypothetical protein ONA91_04470 [Micromonospora sp. DR5-3]|uniref:hypothetical protein n=1 Tax=unclassified Micromonospora TaxID=2617518 RepID=UPI001652799B|nr:MULTISPECIES: hypothetical protein [unclassified Micromonospora]MCW3813713.1 hypothetical protein [Micromonospora sp. DR5-3]